MFLDAFVIWLCVVSNCAVDLGHVVSNANLVDKLLCGYAQGMYNRKLPISRAPNTILTMSWWCRPLKGCPRQAWDSTFSWKAELPVRLRVPFPWVVLEAIARYAMYMGLCCEVNRFHWIGLSVVPWDRFLVPFAAH